MPDIQISLAEADALIAMEKVRVNDETHRYPVSGSVTVPLQSLDKREQFLLDISRGRIDLLRGRYQNRGQLSLESRSLLFFAWAKITNRDGQH